MSEAIEAHSLQVSAHVICSEQMVGDPTRQTGTGIFLLLLIIYGNVHFIMLPTC